MSRSERKYCLITTSYLAGLFDIVRADYTVRLWRMRQAYNRPTIWLGSIYTRTTFSLTKLNTQKFAPGFTERKSSNKRKKKYFPIFLSNEMFFALIRSVLFEKRFHVNQPTTSPAILTQENFSLVPYAVEIFHKIRMFSRFRLRLSQCFKTCFKILRQFFWRTQQS